MSDIVDPTDKGTAALHEFVRRYNEAIPPKVADGSTTLMEQTYRLPDGVDREGRPIVDGATAYAIDDPAAGPRPAHVVSDDARRYQAGCAITEASGGTVTVADERPRDEHGELIDPVQMLTLPHSDGGEPTYMGVCGMCPPGPIYILSMGEDPGAVRDARATADHLRTAHQRSPYPGVPLAPVT